MALGIAIGWGPPVLEARNSKGHGDETSDFRLTRRASDVRALATPRVFWAQAAVAQEWRLAD